jgi:hypothetical protein
MHSTTRCKFLSTLESRVYVADYKIVSHLWRQVSHCMIVGGVVLRVLQQHIDLVLAGVEYLPSPVGP